ncbi:MAG: LCP family protein [Anaerolineaceae bacterium]|nr:LCP family protein [Anaerolineaceae bacterium]
MVNKVNIEKLNVVLIFLVIIFAAYMLIFDAPNAQAATVQRVENIHLYADTTATPFQPVNPTETPTPTQTAIPPTATATPISTATPIATETPTPIPWQKNVDMPDGQITFLILGTDARSDGLKRTDVIILMIVNPDNGTVSMVSFPRDLFVYIPYHGQNRINAAYAYGGFDLLAETFEYNFGIRPDYYMMTDFNNFIEIINKLGGLDVEVEKTLEDKCDLPQQVNTYCEVNPGTIHMDADTALWYVRSRKTTSDLDRIRRQQEVLKAIGKKVVSLDVILQAPVIYDRFINYVYTNLDYEAVMQLAFAAVHMNGEESVHKYLIGQGQVYDYVFPGSGAMVLMPDMYAVNDLLNQAIRGE